MTRRRRGMLTMLDDGLWEADARIELEELAKTVDRAARLPKTTRSTRSAASSSCSPAISRPRASRVAASFRLAARGRRFRPAQNPARPAPRAGQIRADGKHRPSDDVSRAIAIDPSLLALAAGAASAFAFQPVGWWPLMLLAFASLCELIARAGSLQARLLIGWVFGVGQFVVGLNWIATAFTFQAAMPAWLGWIAVVLLSLYLAVYPALAAGLAWRFGREQAASRCVLALAGGWAITEWLRADDVHRLRLESGRRGACPTRRCIGERAVDRHLRPVGARGPARRSDLARM